MRFLILVVVNCLFVCSSLPAQTDSLIDIQMAPTFPGGEQALLDFLKNNFQIPVIAEGLEGRVIASFIIEKDGSVGEVAIVQPLHPAVDAEMLRMVRSMPAWQPGRANGHPVRVRYSLPMEVWIPRQTKARTVDFDFYFMLGGGFWTGTFQDYYSQPMYLYNSGISFPIKSWRLGFDVMGANATAREDRVIREKVVSRGQELVFGWLSLEAQRPRMWTERLIFAPLVAAGLGFQHILSPASPNADGPDFWGAQLRVGAQLDWILARRTYESRKWEPFTLRHALRFRGGVGPVWLRYGGDPGLMFFGSVGYALHSRKTIN